MNGIFFSKVGFNLSGNKTAPAYEAGIIRKLYNKIKGEETFSRQSAIDMDNAQEFVRTGVSSDLRTRDAYLGARFAQGLAGNRAKEAAVRAAQETKLAGRREAHQSVLSHKDPPGHEDSAAMLASLAHPDVTVEMTHYAALNINPEVVVAAVNHHLADDLTHYYATQNPQYQRFLNSTRSDGTKPSSGYHDN